MITAADYLDQQLGGIDPQAVVVQQPTPISAAQYLDQQLGQQATSQPEAQTQTAAPQTTPDPASIFNNQQSLPQQMQQWANTPATFDDSLPDNLPQQPSFSDKIGLAATALGRGIRTSVENNYIKPAVGGIAEMMSKSAGEIPAATDDPLSGDPMNLSPNALGALSMMSPVMKVGLPTAASAVSPATSAIGKFISQPTVAGDLEDQTMNNIFAAKPLAPTHADVKALANSLYGQANASGAVLSPDFTNRILDQLSSAAPQTAEGAIVSGESPVSTLLTRMQGLRDKPLTLNGAQEIDEHLGDLIDNEYNTGKLSKQGSKIASMQGQLRDAINQAGPEDITGGADGIQALQQGRQAWSQAMKMGDVQRVIDRANLTDNPATSLKTGFRNLYLNGRGYSSDEKAALKSAASTGITTDALRVFGSRLLPMGATIAGEAMGGLPGAAIAGGLAHGATTFSRNMATAIQTNKAQKVMDLLGNNAPLFGSLAPPK